MCYRGGAQCGITRQYILLIHSLTVTGVDVTLPLAEQALMTEFKKTEIEGQPDKIDKM